MKRFLTTVLCLLVSGALAAEERPYLWSDVERIVAIGDVHGAYDNFVKVLQNAKLIDDKERWIGGTAHLVQTGDLVDRGPESRKAMDLLMKLEEKASDAGGRVHVLIGNHEAMNIVGILDLVSKEEFEAFVDRGSRELHDRTFERYYDRLRQEARDRGEDPPSKGEVRTEFDEDYPLGYIEHRQAFGEDGRYGEWIRGLNTSIKVNGVVFSHGDWSEEFSRIGLEEVNRRIRQELRGELPIQEGLTFDPNSPLQYRGLAKTPLTKAAQQAEEGRVNGILENLDAKRMVVGHTLTGGVIESRFGGKHISIDTGMLELYRGGHRIALDIVDGDLYSIHDGGTIPLPEQMDETNLDAYMLDVAKVDPTNVDVQLKLVDVLRDQGRLDDTVLILEALFDRTSHEYVPFRYRDILGTQYMARGETRKAEAQFRAYIDGLRTLVDKNPDNLNLANLLARFCLEKSVELDLAEEVIQRAFESDPGNYNFRLTLARVQLAREEYGRVLELLNGTPSEIGFDYEAHYITGLAYLGLNERDEARAAFQRAVNAEPSRQEARQELRKLEENPP